MAQQSSRETPHHGVLKERGRLSGAIDLVEAPPLSCLHIIGRILFILGRGQTHWRPGNLLRGESTQMFVWLADQRHASS
jgi:hypothetical protein